MGNKYSRNSALAHIGTGIPGLECSVTIEVFKWKSQRFPQEYALIYTSVFDRTSRCVLRVSANRDKARLTVQDDLCHDDAQLSLAVEVTAVRDVISGKYRRGPPTVDWQAIDDYNINGPNRIYIREITGPRSCFYDDWELIVDHHLSAFRDKIESLYFLVAFKCHMRKGLVVKLIGPLLQGKQYIHRIVEGDPEDYSNNKLIVEKDDRPLPRYNVPRSVETGGAIRATGAVNNVMPRNLGMINRFY